MTDERAYHLHDTLVTAHVTQVLGIRHHPEGIGVWIDTPQVLVFIPARPDNVTALRQAADALSQMLN